MYAHKKDMYKMYMKKTLKNRIREEQNKWKHVPCTWIGIMSIVKMSVLPNLIHRFSVALDRIPAKFKWKGKRHRVANTVLKKNKIRGLRLL